MFKYIKNTLSRKKARKVTQEYAPRIDNFDLQDEGNIQFANWTNPLVPPKKITQSEINFYKQFIKKGDLVIDIGTNVGDTTVPMAIAAGREGLTIGFDPNPFVFKILEVNAGLNKSKTNIVAYPYAITEKESEFFYRSSEASFANGGIKEIDETYHGKFSLEHKIKGIRLSDFLKKNHPDQLNKLSFIKVDAEGLDTTILKSIRDLVEEYKPVVIAECFTGLTPEQRYDLFDTVALPGYQLYKFDDFKDTAPVTAITDKKDMLKWKTFNLYGIHA
ncbi:MAG: FkbM family methyltransferase [Chitinophagaceae bacterium]|nr:FkbM family methyltransferase [Chitinophagaceae bacterium]